MAIGVRKFKISFSVPKRTKIKNDTIAFELLCAANIHKRCQIRGILYYTRRVDVSCYMTSVVTDMLS